MNILFLTISRIDDISARGIYTDLMRKFRDEGHNVYIVTPTERRYKKGTTITEQEGVNVLKVKTLNIQKTNLIEKGIGTLLIDYQFLRAVKKCFASVKFDLILYSTPPITLSKTINAIKKRDGAITYLLLKDIFPQNALDLGIFSRNSIFHKYFRIKEKQLYRYSDYIGCMSPANVEYIRNHNPFIVPSKVEICPNSIEIKPSEGIAKQKYRSQYNIPLDAVIFVYAGNLGRPQGVHFLEQILEINNKKADRFFLIIGDGTEFIKIESWFSERNFSNASLLPILPKEEYDNLVSVCDVGLILLDPRFTIPNFPSRLLSYLENKMPIIAATDLITDIGIIAEDNGFGYKCLNGDIETFVSYLDKFCLNKGLMFAMGEKGYEYLKQYYSVDQSYDTIMTHFRDK